jgi:dUTP pyrophosphatase
LTTIRFKRLDPRAQAPTQAHQGDAFDLRSIDEVILEPGVPTLVKTGIAIELPQNMRAWVTPRSGLALRHGITVANSPGLVDPSYRGEVGVILVWGGKNSNATIVDPWRSPSTEMDVYRVLPGDRVAQLSIDLIPAVELIEAEDELSSTDRGDSGFGASGK